jgi:hypothetical protein
MPVTTGERMAVLERDVKALGDGQSRIEVKLDRLFDEGIPRRMLEIEAHDEKQDKRMDDQDDMIDRVCKAQDALAAEMRGALRVLKWGGAILATFSLLLIILSNLHTVIGWLEHP